MPATKTLLVEILVEELPPRLVADIARQFADNLCSGLVQRGFAEEGPQPRIHSTIRRLAALVEDVCEKTDDRKVFVRGPATAAALDLQGNPTKALEGFAAKLGVGAGDLERSEHKGKEHFCGYQTVGGERLDDTLSKIVETALGEIRAPRLMRWAGHDRRFIRPVRGVLFLHGSREVPGEVMGVRADRHACGNRMSDPKMFAVESAGDYPETLREKGGVLVSPEARTGRIRDALMVAERENGVHLTGEDGPACREAELNADLLDENAAMVEMPYVMTGSFDKSRLTLPKELLSACMQGQQKSFMALDANGAPLPMFAFVSGNRPHPNIVRGNERVLAARLADGAFFFGRDLNISLETFDEALARTAYHHRLGSLGDRAVRVSRIAVLTAVRLDADVDTVRAAAMHALRDLASETVQEFPELQGRIIPYLIPKSERNGPVGRALKLALERIYTPPHLDPPHLDGMGPEAGSIVLAFHAEQLTGLFAAGEEPTGDKDPFGLRRCALGIAKMAVRHQMAFPLAGLIADAAKNIGLEGAADGFKSRCHSFVTDRLRNNPELATREGFTVRPSTVRAALQSGDDVLSRLPDRCEALDRFSSDPAAAQLIESAKRIANIFRKSGVDRNEDKADPRLFETEQERILHRRIEEIEPRFAKLKGDGRYGETLGLLGSLAEPLARFFDHVLVNDDNPAIRRNRFLLLGQIQALLAEIADFSQIDL